MKLINKLLTIKEVINFVNWNYNNPNDLCNEIIAEVSELEKENIALKAKSEVYESIQKDTKINDKK